MGIDLRFLQTEIIILLTAFAVLIADLFLPEKNKKAVPYLGLAGLILAFIPAIIQFQAGERLLFSSALILDGFTSYFRLVFLAAGGLVFLAGIGYKDIPRSAGEFYTLILFSILGITLLAGANDLIMLYIALELVSLSCYPLAGFLKEDYKSNEAALKYFLLGAASSAILLYGISLIYGMAKTTNLIEIGNAFSATPVNPALFIALLLFLAGLGFKLALVPFHMWCPDVYEGSPTLITAFLSVGPKLAGFAALTRVLTSAFGNFQDEWINVLVILSVLSMCLGNLAAIPQRNIKRMLAYSSIAQAGYMLIGLISVSSGGFGLPGLLIYLVAYLFTNLGAFSVVIYFEHKTGSNDIADYTGLSTRSPFLAAMLTIFLLSLVGIPPLAGFVGKFCVFAGAIEVGFIWLAVIGVINSVISLYYYFNVVRVMYLNPAVQEGQISAPYGLKLAIIVAAGFTLLIGLLPQGFLNLARICAP
jgi:proton-translocating NADH-quinone oxidoreductase chain N